MEGGGAGEVRPSCASVLILQARHNHKISWDVDADWLTKHCVICCRMFADSVSKSVHGLPVHSSRHVPHRCPHCPALTCNQMPCCDIHVPMHTCGPPPLLHCLPSCPQTSGACCGL
jgi:hypothetical protein